MFRLGFHSLSRIHSHFLGFHSLSSLQHNHGSSLKVAPANTALNGLTPLFSLPGVTRFSTAAVKQDSEKFEPVKSKPAIDSADVPNLASSDVAVGPHPEVQWAEREDKVYLTVMLADAKSVKIDIDEGVFTFSGTAGADNNCYELKLELLDDINVEESKVNIGAEKIFCILMKDEKKWWKKLLHGDGIPPHYVKVDCDKWAEEDGDEAPVDVDTGRMDFLKFQKFKCGTGQLPDMNVLDNLGLDFAGFGEKDGKTFARYTYRKTAEMMRQMGPEEAKKFKTVILDPNNPDDMNKMIYF